MPGAVYFAEKVSDGSCMHDEVQQEAAGQSDTEAQNGQRSPQRAPAGIFPGMVQTGVQPHGGRYQNGKEYAGDPAKAPPCVQLNQ